MTIGIFGGLEPTARYLRIVWGDNKENTLDLQDSLEGLAPEFGPVVGGSIAEMTGNREALWARTDEFLNVVTPPLRGFDAARVERWLRECALKGIQFEFYLTRTLRAWWGFDDDTAFDNNRGNEFRNGNWTGTALSYADVTLGRGVTLPSAGLLQTSLVSMLTGGSANKFFGPLEGDLVLVVKPDYAGNDGAEHFLLDCFPTGNRWKNSLRITKRQDNVLHVTYVDSTGRETTLQQAVSWAANSEHTLLIEWGATNAAFRATLDGTEIVTKRYPLVASGAVIAGGGTIAGTMSATPNGGETVMDDSPDTVTMGTDDSGQGGRGSGTYGMLTIYRATFASALPTSLTTFEFPWRSYFPLGELADTRQGALRVSPRGEKHRYQFRIRDGR